MHYRDLFTAAGWHDTTVSVSVTAVGDEPADLTVYTTSDLDINDVKSEEYTLAQVSHLVRILGCLTYPKIVALVGSLGAAVSLLSRDESDRS